MRQKLRDKTFNFIIRVIGWFLDEYIFIFDFISFTLGYGKQVSLFRVNWVFRECINIQLFFFINWDINLQEKLITKIRRLLGRERLFERE